MHPSCDAPTPSEMTACFVDPSVCCLILCFGGTSNTLTSANKDALPSMNAQYANFHFRWPWVSPGAALRDFCLDGYDIQPRDCGAISI